MIQVQLNTEVVAQLQEDEKLLMRICLLIDCKLDTLKRWLTRSDEKLTQYSVLLAIGEVLQLSIPQIVEVEYFDT